MADAKDARVKRFVLGPDDGPMLRIRPKQGETPAQALARKRLERRA